MFKQSCYNVGMQKNNVKIVFILTTPLHSFAALPCSMALGLLFRIPVWTQIIMVRLREKTARAELHLTPCTSPTQSVVLSVTSFHIT